MATSPAVDAANPTNFPATDQRNVSRPEDGSLNGTVLPDIGAYERQVVTLMVTKTADTSDGTCDGDCSLREALAAANTAAVPDKGVIFDEVLFSTPQTITLTLGELLINNISGTLLINGKTLYKAVPPFLTTRGFRSVIQSLKEIPRVPMAEEFLIMESDYCLSIARLLKIMCQPLVEVDSLII
jgi:CSLREA domain-containing protein